MLTDEQKRPRVKVAEKLLQMFPNYDKKQFANVVTCDETRVHYFEPVRQFSNKIWATKHSKSTVIAKRSLHARILLWWRSGNKSAGVKGQKHHRKVLQRSSTEETENLKCYQKRRPVTGFKHICLLHDNVTAHISAIITAFLKKEKSNCFASTPLFPRPCPM